MGLHNSKADTESFVHGISMLTGPHHGRAWTCPECQLATDSLLPIRRLMGLAGAIGRRGVLRGGHVWWLLQVLSPVPG